MTARRRGERLEEPRATRPPPIGRLLRLAEAGLAAGLLLVALGLALGLEYFDAAFWEAFVTGRGLGSPLLVGFQHTLYYMAVIIPVGLLVGFLWGWARTTRHRLVVWPVAAAVEFLRGVPPIVLVIFAFLFGGALVGRGGDQFSAGLAMAAFALAFHTAAYQSELFRAGFQSVPNGQVEAAHALGMTGGQTMFAVVLPQALRLSLPPLGNEFANTVKDTSLLAAVGAAELFAQGLEFSQVAALRGALDWWLLIWLTVAAVYLAVILAVTRALRFVETRLRVPGLEGAAA